MKISIHAKLLARQPQPSLPAIRLYPPPHLDLAHTSVSAVRAAAACSCSSLHRNNAGPAPYNATHRYCGKLNSKFKLGKIIKLAALTISTEHSTEQRMPKLYFYISVELETISYFETSTQFFCDEWRLDV